MQVQKWRHEKAINRLKSLVHGNCKINYLFDQNDEKKKGNGGRLCVYVYLYARQTATYKSGY